MPVVMHSGPGLVLAWSWPGQFGACFSNHSGVPGGPRGSLAGRRAGQIAVGDGWLDMCVVDLQDFHARHEIGLGLKKIREDSMILVNTQKNHRLLKQ